MSRFSGSIQNSNANLAARKQAMKDELKAEKEAKKAEKNAAKEYMSTIMDLFEEADKDASGNLDYNELFDLVMELYRKEGVEASEEDVGMQLDAAYAEVPSPHLHTHKHKRTNTL